MDGPFSPFLRNLSDSFAWTSEFLARGEGEEGGGEEWEDGIEWKLGGIGKMEWVVNLMNGIMDEIGESESLNVSLPPTASLLHQRSF